MSSKQNNENEKAKEPLPDSAGTSTGRKVDEESKADLFNEDKRPRDKDQDAKEAKGKDGKPSQILRALASSSLVGMGVVPTGGLTPAGRARSRGWASPNGSAMRGGGASTGAGPGCGAGALRRPSDDRSVFRRI